MSATCRSCGAPVEWAETVNGKRVPFDPDPVPNLEGSMLFRLTEHPQGGDTLLAEFVKPADRYRGGELYVSHFATCPDAARWRKS